MKPEDIKTCDGRMLEILEDQLELHEQWSYEPGKSRPGLSKVKK